MWDIDSLFAVDEKTGSYVQIEDGVVKICLVKNSVSTFRRVKLKELPPCLSAAVNDLLKFLAKENPA